jgi:uncharacterized membrane protein
LLFQRTAHNNPVSATPNEYFYRIWAKPQRRWAQSKVLVKLFSPFGLSLAKAFRATRHVVRQAHHERRFSTFSIEPAATAVIAAAATSTIMGMLQASRLAIMSKLWHQIRARPRLIASAAIGVVVYTVLPAEHAASTRALISWDVGAGLYLILAWIMIGRATVDHMRWRARVQDDGAAVVLFLTVVAAIASLAAIILELSGMKGLSSTRQVFHVGLAGATFAASWLLIHTSFALHYAHAFYGSMGEKASAPLEFPGTAMPIYGDFLYFALVIGMTSQTADVAINNTRMRRLAMCHGLVAFAFNTTLLALTVNIAASLVG